MKNSEYSTTFKLKKTSSHVPSSCMQSSLVCLSMITQHEIWGELVRSGGSWCLQMNVLHLSVVYTFFYPHVLSSDGDSS